MSTFPRTWSLAREDEVHSWPKGAERAWDAGVAGNSALREVFVLRALRDEWLARLGISFGEGVIDAMGFYDAMEWVPLARSALRLGFPPVVLALELHMRLAPHVLSQMNSRP